LLDLIQQRGHSAKALARTDDAFTAPADPTHAQWLGTNWASDADQTQQALGDQVVEWLVVDHYALDRRWEHALRPHTKRIMAVDDLADRQHDCELLLDQNLGRQAKDYAGLLSCQTQTLIGPAYALLRPEFAQWRDYSLQRRAQPQLKNLLITMGGVDSENATGQVLDALCQCDLPADLRITVVMGPTAPWLAQVQAQVAAMPRPTQVLAGVSNMAQLMAASDLCIGAAGGSAWERCALGLPTLVLILAANQQSGAMALQSHEAAWVAADAKQLMAKMPALFNKETQTAALKKMSQAAAKLATGNGASQVVELLLEIHV
jgi:UDP-2,4-diacetamido-2,4,6-trideoxy-beta-L-altropyranose hydrolase